MLCNFINFEAFKKLKSSKSVTESVTIAINKKWRKVLRPRVKFGQNHAMRRSFSIWEEKTLKVALYTDCSMKSLFIDNPLIGH